MTEDLFSSTGAELAQTGACASSSGKVNWRTGALAQTSAPVAHSGAEPVSLPEEVSARKPARRKKEKLGESLYDKRTRLLQELGEAREEQQRASVPYLPLAAQFKAIDDWCKQWSMARHAGRVGRHPQWMAALDERMAAGHAKHPYEKQYLLMVRWVNAVLKELKIVNEEIGA